jgi:hypothetical protein
MRWRHNATLYKLPPLCFHHKYTQWRYKLIPLSTRYWKPLRKDLLYEDGGPLKQQEIHRPWGNLFFATIRHLALFVAPGGSFQYFRPVTHCASVTLNSQWIENLKCSSKVTLCRCPHWYYRLVPVLFQIPEQAMKAHKGTEVYFYSFFNLSPTWGWVIKVTNLPFYRRGKRRGTHCIAGWVGPGAGLDGCGKSCIPPAFASRTF